MGDELEAVLDAYCKCYAEDVDFEYEGKIEEQLERSIFLEYPLVPWELIRKPWSEEVERENDSVKAAREAMERLKEKGKIGFHTAHHLKPIGSIKGKLGVLFDVRVIVVEQIPASTFKTSGVNNWMFVVVADESGGCLAGFPLEVPKSLTESVGNCSLSEIFSHGNILMLCGMKTITLQGTLVITFSKQSRIVLIGNFMMDYSLDFAGRG